MVPSPPRLEKAVSQLSIYMDFRARPGVPPEAADFEDGITLVRAAERLGFAHVWTTEQHGVDDGYLPAQLPMLAALARETSRIRPGTAVILLPLTHPRRVVEEACVVGLAERGKVVAHLEALAAEVAPRSPNPGDKSEFAVLTVITLHGYRSLTVDS